MIGRVGLLMLIAAGPQPGLSAQSNYEIRAQSNEEAMEVTANGAASKADGDSALMRRTASQNSAPPPDPDVVEPASVNLGGQNDDSDVEAQANGRADTVSLCGQTCKSVVEGGAPCDAFYGSGCRGAPPPGFTTLSELYDICPIACGQKPDDSTGSMVWLWVLLIILILPLAVIGAIAAFLKCFFPKTYDLYAARAQQVIKSWEGKWNEWKYGIPYEYEEWDDEEDWDEDEEDESFEEAGASGSQRASVSQSYDDGSAESMRSASMMGDATAVMDQTMMASGTMVMDQTMMPSGTTMMPGGTTMMPGGSSATMMMGSSATMMPTMVQEPTAMMGSSATMMMGSSATMMQEPTMMMGSSATMMDEQATMMMGSSIMGSAVMEDQATMQNFSSTDTL